MKIQAYDFITRTSFSYRIWSIPITKHLSITPAVAKRINKTIRAKRWYGITARFGAHRVAIYARGIIRAAAFAIFLEDYVNPWNKLEKLTGEADNKNKFSTEAKKKGFGYIYDFVSQLDPELYNWKFDEIA